MLPPKRLSQETAMSHFMKYPHYPYAPASGQYPHPAQSAYYPSPQTSWTQGWLAFNGSGYVKGLLLGAAATYLLTNPKVQKAVVKGAVALWTSVQGSVEEVKEQIQDIKAEMSMKTDADKQ